MHCLGTEESMHTEPEKVSKGILVFPAVLDTSSLSWGPALGLGRMLAWAVISATGFKFSVICSVVTGCYLPT